MPSYASRSSNDTVRRMDAMRRERLGALLTWLWWGLVLLAAIWGQRVPEPLPATADPAVFSAMRARAVLVELLGDERPHRLGTAANAAVADRVVAAFADIGLSAERRPRFVCADYGVCGRVENLLVRLPGAGDEAALLLTSHYDSVGAGPGAGDAGAGTAALVEIARALQADAGPRREILILVADGEEAGLLGAEAFVQEPEFARVGAVLNLEARGTRGRANLFETQPGNAALIAALAPALPDPALSSLAYEIYQRMPNNTDFSVYKREGLAGANFAFIGGGARYHTPLDDLAHLDSGSLQHLGDGALAAARALATPGTTVVADADRVYFDWAGRVWHWSARANLLLLALGTLGLAVFLMRAYRSGTIRVRAVALAGGLALAAPLLAGALAAGALGAWQGLGAVPMPWTANAHALQFAAAAIGLAVALSVAARAIAWTGVAAWLAALLLLLWFAAVALIWMLPGGAYLALVPLLAVAPFAALAPARCMLIAAVLAASLLATQAASLLQLHDSLGPTALVGLGVLVAAVMLPLGATLPALSPWRARLLLGAWVLALGAVGVAALRPPFDADTRATLVLRDIAGPEGRVLHLSGLAAGEDATWLSALPKPPAAQRVLPWVDAEVPTVALQGEGLAPPTAALSTDATGARRIELTPPEPEALVALILPAAVPLAAVRVDGVAFAAPIRRQRAQTGAWRSVFVYPTGAPVRFEIDWPEGVAAEAYALAQSAGAAPDLHPIATARNRVAVPAHFGDARIGYRKLDLNPTAAP
ncbi:MAG: M28 family peptidase [Xanthomonadales bacterium]|nr:M28 family peptidase [Xanthomonadales bacterium]